MDILPVTTTANSLDLPSCRHQGENVAFGTKGNWAKHGPGKQEAPAGILHDSDEDSVESDDSPTNRLVETLWEDVPQGSDDAILGIARNFNSCKKPSKVSVCIGAYRDEFGKPWVLPSVREAEQRILKDGNKEYLPIEGDAAFIEKALSFAYGKDADLTRIAGVQSLSGTGACRIGGRFLALHLPAAATSNTIYIPVPTWGNHWTIFQECGLETKPYRYFSRANNALDLTGMLEDMKNAPEGSIILLHACAHNPTGCDPTMDEWKKITHVLEKKKHIAFFDSAYQGFASGDAERDAAALRYVVSRGTVPVLLAQSFAKNFGLYGERCGTLSVVCGRAEQRDRIMSQLRLVIRPMYSSPPKQGSSIVRIILSDEKLSAQYYQECKRMADRIQSMREKLVNGLVAVGSKHDWSHVSSQIGMFAFTGMTAEMCDRITDEYSIYLTRDGRISLAGLNESNLDYVVNAIHAVTDGKSITEDH